MKTYQLYVQSRHLHDIEGLKAYCVKYNISMQCPRGDRIWMVGSRSQLRPLGLTSMLLGGLEELSLTQIAQDQSAIARPLEGGTK